MIKKLKFCIGYAWAACRMTWDMLKTLGKG